MSFNEIIWGKGEMSFKRTQKKNRIIDRHEGFKFKRGQNARVTYQNHFVMSSNV